MARPRSGRRLCWLGCASLPRCGSGPALPHACNTGRLHLGCPWPAAGVGAAQRESLARLKIATIASQVHRGCAANPRHRPRLRCAGRRRIQEAARRRQPHSPATRATRRVASPADHREAQAEGIQWHAAAMPLLHGCRWERMLSEEPRPHGKVHARVKHILSCTLHWARVKDDL